MSNTNVVVAARNNARGSSLSSFVWLLLAALLAGMFSTAAQAEGFTGFYSFGSWTTAQGPGSAPNFTTFASVDGTQQTLTLEEPEGTCCSPIEFTFSHVVASGGTVSFDWTFNWDADPCCSGLNFYVNGTLYNLANGSFPDAGNSDDGNASGTFTIAVNAGDTIAFGAFSQDGCCLAAISTITNFFAPDFLEMLSGEAAILSAGQALVGGCIAGDDLLIGDGDAHRSRMWAKAGRGNRASGGDTGLDASHDYSCGSGGVDFSADDMLRLGLSGGYGDSDSSVATLAGPGRLKGAGGAVQLYAEFHSGDFFANLTAGYGAFDWTYHAPTLGIASAVSDGMIASLQAGHYWPLGSVRIAAIGEVSYDDVDCGSDCLLAATSVDLEHWSYKGTIRADAMWSSGKLHPYLAVSLAGGASNSVTNSSLTLVTDTNALHAIAKAGADFTVDQQTALFINGGFIEGIDKDINGWDVAAGFKAVF